MEAKKDDRIQEAKFKVRPGENIRSVAFKLTGTADTKGKSYFLVFNGVRLVAHPGDFPAEIVGAYKKAKEKQQVKPSKKRGGWTKAETRGLLAFRDPLDDDEIVLSQLSENLFRATGIRRDMAVIRRFLKKHDLLASPGKEKTKKKEPESKTWLVDLMKIAQNEIVSKATDKLAVLGGNFDAKLRERNEQIRILESENLRLKEKISGLEKANKSLWESATSFNQMMSRIKDSGDKVALARLRSWK